MSALCFLHGFLGAKEDWDPIIHQLQDEFFCHAIDFAGQSLEEIEHIFQTLEPAPKFFIGYSLGGRILLKLKKAQSVILAAHPGLESAQEREARWKSDSKWIEILNTRPLSEFFEAWYAQDLFAPLKENKALFEEMMKRRKSQDPALLAKTLATYSLAHDIPSLFPGPLFVYGEKDLKFQKLYLKLPSFLKVKKIENAGHALHLENPKACSALIRGYIHERSQSKGPACFI
ncbi:MAG TPA: alpha/beta fold hydrolase [Rhabdochlamydiaceae bacterium]|nr:alpha/beta fold hydrolase [Rhabdochlamydiaceae bacterium]